MKNPLVKALIGFIVPVAAVILLFKWNILLGIAALAIYIALVLFGSRAMIFSMLGTRNYGMGNTEQALKWFKRAHDLKQAGVRPSISYSYILLRSGNLSESEAILRSLLEKYPKSEDLPLIKSNLALALWKKGQLDEAIAILEEVMKNYKTTSTYGSLGYLLIAGGDLEKALKFNLEAYEYNSTDKIILDNLGQNYLLLGMYDKSREIYENLVAKAPTFPEPYFNYGLLLEKLGEPQKAYDMMQKALNYKFSYLNCISKEDVESKLKELGYLEQESV